MLNIIRHLKTQGESTYKEMAKELGVSERSVRYDVDRINDILSLERLPEIARLPEMKGQGILLIEYTTPEGSFKNHYLYGRAPFKLDEYRKLLRKTKIYDL